MDTQVKHELEEPAGGQASSKDRRFLQVLVGIAAAFSVMLVVYSLVSDLPRGETDVTIESDAPAAAPPEDVRR